MKKKNLVFCGVAAAAALTLASCGPKSNTPTGGNVKVKSYYTYQEAPADEVYATDGGRLDISVNYGNTDGITFRKADAFQNLVDGETYTKDSLLPTWKAFAEKTKTQIFEASDYKGKETVDAPLIEKANFMSQKDEKQAIDCLYQKTNQIISWGTAGKIVDLSKHLDKMPNFSKYLEANPSVKKDITASNGAMYYTPYFDSYNDVERMIIMDTSLVEKVLDATSFDAFDTTTNGGSNPAANVVQKGSYTPYINATKNYAADTKVNVLKDGKVKSITIKQTDNIIVKQNAALANGVTGKKLAEDFKEYLTAAFGHEVGAGKTYEKYSEIFTSTQAAYNIDELIALMRVVKANPGVISGDANAEIETLQPRGEDASRVQNILHFAQNWGVQGLVSEKDFLYYLQDGTLNDARTTKASYQALQNLAAMYEEGLIVTNFWYKGSTQNKNLYLQKNYQKILDDWGYGLCEYDYAATQVVANDEYDGVGTKASKRKGAAASLKVTGIKPILAPLAYWPTGAGVTNQTDLTDFSNKTLMRHYDENRSTKDTGFSIPANTDNLEGALRLIDYLWSPMGRLIQDYGPESHWNKPTVAEGKDSLAKGLEFDANKSYVANDYIEGELVPILSAKVKNMWSASGNDYWSFMRGYIGSTHGVGHERSKSIQLQCCNYYGQKGLADLESAIASGVVDVSLNNKDGDSNDATVTWNTSVPTANWNAPEEQVMKDNYAAVTAFWDADKYNGKALGWVYVVQAGKGADLSNADLGKAKNEKNYKMADVEAQQDAFNKKYLYAMANSLGAAFIPSYAKSN